MEPPKDLVASILSATSGSPCRAAEERLPDLVDGLLEGVDEALVREHLGSCANCTALERALAELLDALPATLDVDPGRAFTAAVVARTSGSRKSRLADYLRGLMLRPAFALEGAYLGSLVLVGLMAFPGSPLKVLPGMAAHAVTATAGEVGERTRALDAQAATAVQGAEKRAERIAVKFREMKQSVERRIDAKIDAVKKERKETS